MKLLFWVGLLTASLLCWVGLIWLAQEVWAWGPWPVVKFALSVGLVGLALFLLSEQVAELYVRDAERRR